MLSLILAGLALSGPGPGLSQQALVNMLWADDGYAFLITADPSIDVLPGVLADGSTPLKDCIDAAKATCGEGQVCGVCVKDNECSFACRDAEGKCDHWTGCDADAEP